MTMKQATPVTIYAESTPNPHSMKFVLNQMLTNETMDFPNPESAGNFPFVLRLFEFSFVRSVFISANFVTVGKDPELEWYELIPVLKEFIKAEIESGPFVTGFVNPVKADPQAPLG